MIPFFRFALVLAKGRRAHLPKCRRQQDSNLRVKITVDFESTPVTTWVCLRLLSHEKIEAWTTFTPSPLSPCWMDGCDGREGGQVRGGDGAFRAHPLPTSSCLGQ